MEICNLKIHKYGKLLLSTTAFSVYCIKNKLIYATICLNIKVKRIKCVKM